MIFYGLLRLFDKGDEIVFGRKPLIKSGMNKQQRLENLKTLYQTDRDNCLGKLILGIVRELSCKIHSQHAVKGLIQILCDGCSGSYQVLVFSFGRSVERFMPISHCQIER